MPDPHDPVEARLALLEQEVARLREQTLLLSSLDATVARVDAVAARVLTARADRDMSEVRAELRGRLRQTSHRYGSGHRAADKARRTSGPRLVPSGSAHYYRCPLACASAPHCRPR
jgi:isocitrate lyase